jgi:hypothetical protein
VLFKTGGDSLGTVATAEAAAVEIVRTLCGSIGLIAAVALRGRRSPERDQLVFETVLHLHAPRLSHSAVTLQRLAVTASRGNG